MDSLMDLLRTLGPGQELSPLTALSTELGSAHGHRDSTGATCGPGRHGHPCDCPGTDPGHRLEQPGPLKTACLLPVDSYLASWEPVCLCVVVIHHLQFPQRMWCSWLTRRCSPKHHR